MKVICDSCHAKYSLSDDKLTKGKTFKIKCKKCGHVIMVKPADEGNADEESTRVVDYNAMSGAQAAAGEADSKIWHVAIGDKTDGPFTVAEVNEQIAAGAISPDALAWNEGLPNWEKISTLSEFSAQFPSSSAAPAAAPKQEKEPAKAAAAEPAARRAEPAAAPRNESAPAPRNEPAPEPAAKAGGFFGAEEEDSSSSTSLKGQRHENSVLFSLDNLQNLAASSAKKPAPRPGYINPASQGSGLVDIQEMAASMNTNKPARQDAMPFDLPAAPVVATPISIAPVLIPAQNDSERPKWMVPVIIGVVVIVVLLGGFVIIKMMAGDKGGGDKVAQKNNQKNNQTPPANNVAANNNMTANNMAVANNTMGPGDMPPDSDMPPDAMTPDMPPDAMTPDGDMPPDAMTPDMPPDAMTPDAMTPDMGGMDPVVVSMNPTMDPGMTEMTPDMPPDTMTPDGGCTKVWCMLKNNAPDCCAPFRGGDTNMGGGDDACANNPNESLTPADVKDGMSNVRTAVNGCFSKFGISGKVTVRVSVGCMGSVQSASASGEHASSPLGGCIEKAVRGAKFPKFKKPSTKSFQYPFVGGG